MKIGYAARWSPLDKGSWSGTSHYSYQQISNRYPVEVFTYKWPWYLREWMTTQKSLNRKIFKKHTSVEFLKAYAKYFCRQLDKDLRKRPVDLLFVSASPQLIAYLKTDIPVIFMIDATFQQIQGYYPYFSNLASYNIRQGIELDKLAFHRADHCMLASEWNKNSAVKDYGVDPAKITVVPCGANLDRVPGKEELKDFDPDHCRLLFLGVDWERKGGQIALDTFLLLKKQGLPVELTIVGCVPPPNAMINAEGITVIPFLDKNKAEDAERLHQLLLHTSFLLLPTRAECAGIVFGESSAYGVPSITTDTGGVTTYVRNGINGFALPLSATASDYAEKINALFLDKDQCTQMRLTARKIYAELLNWDNWGTVFARIAEGLTKK